MDKNKLFLIYISVVVIVSYLCSNSSLAQDLAGIEWEEFKNKSELVFSGYLIRAELTEANQEIYYTYRISKVFKGEKLKEISFKSPSGENINKKIGRLAILALKKVDDEWKLSIDERSCWIHENKMKVDFGGYPTYKIPTSLLYNFPMELGEKAKLQKLYQDGYHVEEDFVYPVYKVDMYLKTYLNKKK